MNLIRTTRPDPRQTDALFRLWNNEYPAGLGYLFPAQLECYLQGLEAPQHSFLADDPGNIYAWAVTFLREAETWFALILDRQYQGRGLGSRLMDHLKTQHPALCGWVADTDRYVRADGSPYPSPLMFYLKNGFEIQLQQRLELPQLSAVKICWHAAGSR